MAYQKPSDIDSFVLQMGKADMRLKALLAEDLVLYLSDPENSIVCTDLGMLIDALMPWLTGSHFKIAQRALEAFTELIGRLGPDFNAYTPTVFPHVVDRLGDSRDTVREKAQLLLHKLLESRVISPQSLLDKLTHCFKHKNAKIREEFLQTIVNTLNEYGTQTLSLKAYILPIVSLLGDPTSTVRDAAIQTLVEIYKHVGDKLRIDLRKKDIHPSKMMALEQKFDEARSAGLLLPSALNSAMHNDEPDATALVTTTTTATNPRTRLVKRTPSASSRKPQSLDVVSSGDAGAVTWEVFEASFDLVPSLTVFNQKDIEDTLKNVNAIIGNKNMDWEKRVDALKKIRSLIQMDTSIFSYFFKELSISFLDILKELRSQVIREACITIAYMCKTFKTKLDSFCAYILQELINLVPNSVKIIASSGTVALKYVIKYTHASKLIPIITTNQLTSKSKDIRSALCEIVGLIFEDWSIKSMERFSSNLKESVFKGISDADNDARRYSRRNFWGLKRNFPELADQIYNTVDASVQKALEREQDLTTGNGTGSMSASLRGSSSSLNSMPGGVIKRRLSSGLRSPATAIPSASSVSTENLTATTTRLQRVPSLPRSYNKNRSGIPVANREQPPPPPIKAGFRSISAVDTAAAQRARARAQYSNLARLKVTSGTASLQGQMAQQARAKKVVGSTPSSAAAAAAAAAAHQHASPEHRAASRRAGVSQSQPASRSTSPSSRSNYGVYSAYRQTGTIPKKKSGIPRSLANSRETSPTRPQTSTVSRNLYQTGSPRRTDRPPINPIGRPVSSQKLLQASREAENALVLSTDDFDVSVDMARLNLRKTSRDESDESEASSVCSERSFDSSYRRNDSGSWNGSRNKLDSFRAPIEDIESIIIYCTSNHWGERKDGLTSLTQFLSDGKMLTSHQLQNILDLFRKMFIDTHTKVYSLFLDAVNELILSHCNYLHDWLFILLTRLFSKLGTAELLVSMHSKIWKTLQVVHEYFPPDLQMQALFRILCDAAQTPSTKSKIGQLKFLEDLAKTYCKPSEFSMLPPAEKAILKVVHMSVDQKSKDLRQQAQQCLIALYNCNTPNMTMILTVLPKNFQDSAKQIIQQHLRKSTSGTNSPSSPLSCSSPKLLLSPQQGPFSLQNHSSQRSRQSSIEQTDSQPIMNTEEVYRNLRKTTTEIQNYSFETKLDRDTNSKDSGISQMGDHQMEQLHFQIKSEQQIGGGGGGGVGNNQINSTSGIITSSNGLNGHTLAFDDFCNGGSSKTQSSTTTTTESNTPENTVRLDSLVGGGGHGGGGGGGGGNGDGTHQKNHTSQKQTFDFVLADNGELIFENNTSERDVIMAAIILNLDSPSETVTQVLSKLETCIKFGNCDLPVKHFKPIMKMLLLLLQSTNYETIIAAIKLLGKMMRSEDMKQSWSHFLELILLKIIDCYKISKEVSREIDCIIPRIAPFLPLDASINILNPVIATGCFPTNLCAIKLLAELVDKQGGLITDIHLDNIMPNIAKSTEDAESMLRKAAVFCIVKLYVALGEEKVRPKFSLLNSSKIRLLNVYIGKAQSKSS